MVESTQPAQTSRVGTTGTSEQCSKALSSQLFPFTLRSFPYPALSNANPASQQHARPCSVPLILARSSPLFSRLCINRTTDPL